MGPISDLVTSTAARSGATATCTLLIPYEWILQNLADSVILSVSVSEARHAPAGDIQGACERRDDVVHVRGAPLTRRKAALAHQRRHKQIRD